MLVLQQPNQNQALKIPDCFGDYDREMGKPFWDPREASCAGGLDPNWKDPRTGSKIRPPCDFFKECGNKIQAARTAQQQLISPAQLYRPPAPPVSSLATTPVPQGWRPAAQPQAPAVPAASGASTNVSQALQAMLAYHQQLESAQRQQRAPQPHPMVPSPQLNHMQALAYGHQQMMPVNHHMPGYLSVPEIQHEDEGLAPVLGREIFRGVLKSFGHTVASFFDNRPMKLKPSL